MQKELRILMIEDSEDDAVLIARELKRGGLRPNVHRVETREDVIQALDRNVWDVVISDYNLPQFSAQGVLDLLKESGLDLPILIVSGAIGEEIAADLMRLGAHDVVLKGRLYRLAPAIERELRESKVRKERRKAEAGRAKALVELKKAVQTRDEFLAIASHELKTPLTPMMLQLQLLQKEADRAEGGFLPARLVKERLEVSVRQMRRLAHLMENLLDVSRIAHHRLVLDFHQIDLSHVITELILHFSKEAETNGCELKSDIQPGVWGEFDSTRIEQIASNLLSNAIKYGSHRPIEISLKSENENIVFQVSDQGIGIQARDQARIFERFERAVLPGEFAGIGVGLYITRLLVEAHGGVIQVVSVPGQGASFTVTLPKRHAVSKDLPETGLQQKGA